MALHHAEQLDEPGNRAKAQSRVRVGSIRTVRHERAGHAPAPGSSVAHRRLQRQRTRPDRGPIPYGSSLGGGDDETQRDVGEGDIRASYSADVIAMMGKTRKPFTFRGQAWVCVGNQHGQGNATQSKAYRLIYLEHFEGTAITYTEKTHDSAAARADPDGFYHGIRVTHRSKDYVLCGPPQHFIPGTTKPAPPAGVVWAIMMTLNTSSAMASDHA